MKIISKFSDYYDFYQDYQDSYVYDRNLKINMEISFQKRLKELIAERFKHIIEFYKVRNNEKKNIGSQETDFIKQIL